MTELWRAGWLELRGKRTNTISLPAEMFRIRTGIQGACATVDMSRMTSLPLVSFILSKVV
jgi:hypothetical protein